MKTMHPTKLSSFIYKKTIQIIITSVTMLALITCIIPLGVSAKSANARTGKTARKIKPQKQIMKSVADIDVDTIIATNHNFGNFRKGFVGDNAVTAASNSPFYKLDVIAKQGSQGISSIFSGSTVNSDGTVLFAGRNAQGESIFAGDSINPPQPILQPVPTGSVFAGAVQLTDSNKSINWLSAISTQSLVVRDTLNPSGATLVATNGPKALDRFDQVNPFSSVNKLGQPVFNGVRNNLVTLASGYRFGYTFLKSYASGLGGTLRPMVADNGLIVVREIETGQVQRIVLFNYGLPGVAKIIADGTHFNDVGTSPGISDGGNILVFQGDMKPFGSANYNNIHKTNSGRGIFASIDLGGGERKMVRIAGTQSEDLSQAGVGNQNGICEESEICISDELGYARGVLRVQGIRSNSTASILLQESESRIRNQARQVSKAIALSRHLSVRRAMQAPPLFSLTKPDFGQFAPT